MGKHIKSLLWLALAGTLLTCKPDKIEPDPLTDGKPRILSITFPGIPNENVSIDQKNFTITIRVPPTIFADMVAQITLTENARIVRGGCNAEYELGVECVAVENQIGLAYKNDTELYPEAVTTYVIKQVATGNLEIGVMKEPIEHILYDDPKPGFYIPAVYLYGNSLPTSVQLTNRENGVKFLIENSTKKEIQVGFRDFVNHLFVRMDGVKNQLPGTYDIDLKMADGKTFRTPQPLILLKGPAYLSSYQSKIFYGQEAKVNSTFFMEGSNLFEGDIALELIDRHGVRTPLNNLTFEPYGLRLGITLPNTMVPGQYVMRLYQFGKDRGFCFRLNVRNGEAPDGRIGTIGDDALPCSLQQPVRIGRGQAVPITYNLTQSLPNRPRIKLTPTSDPSKTFYGSVIPIVLAPNPLGPGRLTIGSEVPTGLYTAVLQYLDTDGKIVLETDPYGQLLEVY